jgi:hypothetical protein
VKLVAAAVVVVVLAVIGYAAVMSGWALYDDEGYVLMSLKQFADGAHLYDQAYTQYGPLFFELFGLPLRALGKAPSHDAARMVTLGFWLVSSACVGLLTRRFAGQASSWGVVGLLLAFVVLLGITAEPLHPGGFLAMVMAGLAVTLVFARSSRRYLIAGVLVATLGLTKVNLGGFATFAIAFALAIDYAPRTRAQRLGRRAMIALGSALPVILIAPSVDVPEWRWLAVSLTATLIALVVVANPRGSDPRRPVAGLVLGGAALTVLVLAIIVVAGTSLSGLVNGVLVEPLGLRDAFTVPPPFDLQSLAASLAVLGFLAYRRRRGERTVPPVLDLIVGVLAVFALAGDTALSLDSPFLAPLLAPVVLLAGEEREMEGLLPVSCLVIFSALQAYPVAGSQVSFGTFLAVVPTVLVLRRGLTAAALRVGRPVWLAPAVALILACAVAVPQLTPELTDYSDGVTLDAPGAKLMRLPQAQRDDLAALLAGMRGCGTVVSYPGVLSLNLWGRVPPPSPTYAGAWMYLLDAQQQDRIVRRVDATSAVCLVKVPELVRFWSQGRSVPNEPLVRWIRRAEGQTTRYGPYILIHVA